jgi:magnesium chelatase family protein
VIAAYRKGYKHFFVPTDNADELKYIPDITIYPLTNFLQLVNLVLHDEKISSGESLDLSELINHHPLSSRVDFKDIKGHIIPKRALTIAAAGMHNTLLV